MILATHALTGAVIGKYISNPSGIIILSLAVHYTLDSFRHGEYFDDRISNFRNTWWKVTFDIMLGLSIIFSYLYTTNPPWLTIKNIFLGTFFSMFPDLLTVIYWRFRNIKILAKIKLFHAWAHHYTRFPKYSPERQWTLRNAFNDILISLAAIILLLI